MSSNKDKDLYYLSLCARYLEASALMHKVASAQAEDRRLLKLCSGEPNEKRLRHQIAQRRRGPKGLRAMNNAIRLFYRYCEKMGY